MRCGLPIFALTFALCSVFAVREASALHAFSPDYQMQSSILDEAKLLHPKLAKDLLELLDDTEYATGVQTVVVTAPGLPQGWKVDYYAKYMATQMGVSTVKPGIIMLVTKNEGQVGFSMAPGLGRIVTPKILQQIVKFDMMPQIKDKDMQQAVRAGTQALAHAVQGKYKTPTEKRAQWLPFAILLPLVVLMQVLFGDGNAARFFGGGAWKRW